MTDTQTKLSLLDLFRNLALFVVALLITFLLLEIGLRTFKPQDPDFYNSEKFLRLYPPPGEPQTLIPNSVGHFTGVPVRINSIGLRDREVTVPKPQGVFRVLVIGDSVTFGFGVNLEETYAKRLETRLNAGPSYSDNRIEVINAGVPRTGLVSYQQFLEAKGRMLQPDLLLVGIVLNDIFDYDAVLQSSQVHLGTSQGVKSRLSVWFREINRALLLHSHLYLFAYMKAKSIVYQTGAIDINAAYEDDLLPLQPPSARQARAWASTLKHLEQLVEAARRIMVPIGLVVFPEEVQLDAQALDVYRRALRFKLDGSALDGTPQRRLTDFGQAHNVPVIDLLPPFREGNTRALFLRNRSISHDWVHPSPAGHDLAADYIQAVLQRLDLVPSAKKR